MDFDTFVREEHPRLVGALAHQCGRLDIAEDAAQEALIRAHRDWDRVGTLASPLGWCVHVGANVARSRFRRVKAELRALGRAAPPHPPDDQERAVERLAVQCAMAELTARQREVVVLRHLLDLTVEETASVLGATPEAVRALTHRAIVALRTHLPATTTPEVPTWTS